MSYSTPEECKEQSNLDALNALSDDDLQKILDRAFSLVNSYTKQRFDLMAGVTLTLDGSGRFRQEMPARVVSLTSVKFLTRNVDGVISSTRIIAATAVFVKGWWVTSNQVFPLGQQNVELVGSTGYSSVPADIKVAECLVTEQIVRLESSGSSAGIGTFEREKIGQYEYEMPDASDTVGQQRIFNILVPAEAQAILDPFKLPLLFSAVKGTISFANGSCIHVDHRGDCIG